MNLNDAALFFRIGQHKVQSGVYRVRCELCGVTGRESVPKIGPNCDAREVKKEVRDHARYHVEKALEEHRDQARSAIATHE